MIPSSRGAPAKYWERWEDDDDYEPVAVKHSP